MFTNVQQRAYKFVNVDAIDESEYPAYRVELTATEVEALVSASPTNIIDLDPKYQRGTIAAKNKAQDKLMHSRQRSLTHIDSIRNDMISVAANGRSKAILPPIWVNARHTPFPVLKYDAQKRELYLVGDDAKLFVFDGWHRILATCGAVRNGQLANRKLMFYIFDGPVEFEARSFRTLNYKALPVDRTRVAWVSSPFTLDLFQIAREFVENVPGMVDQLEVTSPRLGGNSAALCTFLGVVNGFLPQDNIQRWDDIDPTSSSERQLVVNFVTEFWNHLTAVRPELIATSLANRKLARSQVPVLLNSVTVQSLFGLAWLYLQCYRPTTATIGDGSIAKMRDLASHYGSYDILFQSLDRLGLQALALDGTSVDFFSLQNPIWQPMLNSNGKMSLSGYKPRTDMFNLLKNHLGIGHLNGISTVAAITSAAPGNRIAARKLSQLLANQPESMANSKGN